MTYYILDDINPYFYNCGHYPEYVPYEMPGELPTTKSGRPTAWATREEAQAEADRLNEHSHNRWTTFLNS